MAACAVTVLPLLNIILCACSVEPFGWVRGPGDGSPASASTIQPEGDGADSAPEAAAVCADSQEVSTVVEEAQPKGKARAKARAAKPTARKRGTSKKRKAAEDSSAGVEGGQAGDQTPATLDTATPAAAGGKGSVQPAEGSGRPTAKRRGRPAERSGGSRRIPGRLQPWACARCTLENPVCDQSITPVALLVVTSRVVHAQRHLVCCYVL